MPASRSRTDRWRDSLAQIRDRRGGIEIAVDHGLKSAGREPESEPHALPDLIWRVRLHDVSADQLTVEQPGTMGQRIALPVDTPLVAAMSIGQNRWMFRSRVLAAQGETLRLRLPEAVERCTRRSRHRISTAELTLPDVRCWMLNDPTTAVRAENANRLAFQTAGAGDPDGPRAGHPADAAAELDHLPAGVDAGPGFRAQLANLGGGGLGLIVQPDQSRAVCGTKLYYTRLDLRPGLPAPLEMTVRMAHTHSDSSQILHAGVAFEFGINPGHRAFVVDQIERYTDYLRESTRRATKAA